MKKIYLDYASTTPIDTEVFQAMLPYLGKKYGNPSSIHFLGQEARAAIDEARQKVADFLGCEREEIIFTGSATEANNLALQSIARNKKLKIKNKKLHIITSAIEHGAVLEPCRALEKEGIEVTYLPVTQDGFIRISDLKKAIRRNTVLVSIMYANNEIGTIQPIAEISNWLKSKIKNQKSKIYFHTDAVQAVNYLDCEVNRLGVDMLTLSGHKIYGPKGVGALYVRAGTPLEPLIYGGGQEEGRRSGTENVAAIVGLGAAIAEIPNSKIQIPKIKKLRNKLLKGILKHIPDVQLNGSLENSLPRSEAKLLLRGLPNILNLSFKGVEGEAVAIALDQEGICVSTGSACAASDLRSSRTLRALGLSEESAHSAVRFSLGKYTTEKEIDFVLKVLPKIIEKLRKISGHKPRGKR